jgi:hypothetical protein
MVRHVRYMALPLECGRERYYKITPPSLSIQTRILVIFGLRKKKRKEKERNGSLNRLF